MSKKIVLMLVLALVSTMIASAADYELNSVTGVWSAVDGGNDVTGVGTNEIRWGEVDGDDEQSGLRFDGTGSASFNEGDTFLLGELTHLNFPVGGGTAADGATLQITMSFVSPTVSPDPEFTFNFEIEETPNENDLEDCPGFQETGTPCDDRITFPDSFGEESYEIEDKLYTLKISGFVDSFPSGSPVSEFITEENQENSAFLVGTLSSVLVAKPQITLVKKTTNGQEAESAPGPSILVGEYILWEYVVQNTGNVELTDVVVTDDMGVVVTCPQDSLGSGEAMTCVGSGNATLGQYENTASATGKHNQNTYESNEKTSHYFGYEETTEVPEFSALGLGLALIGALGIVAAVRRKN